MAVERAKASSLMQAAKGTILIKKATMVDKVFLVLKGRVAFMTEGSRVVLGPGSFLGINEFYTKITQGDYVVLEDVTYCMLQEIGPEPVRSIAEVNKEYNGLMVYSLSKYVSDLWKINVELFEKATTCFELVNTYTGEYTALVQREGLKKVDLSYIEELRNTARPCLPWSDSFEYYREDCRVTPDQHKAYFADSVTMTEFHVKRQAEAINTLVNINREFSSYIEHCFSTLVGTGADNLFRAFTDAAIKLASVSKSNDEAIETCCDIFENVEEIGKQLKENVGLNFEFNKQKLSKVLAAAQNGDEYNFDKEDTEEEDSGQRKAKAQRRMREAKDSLKKLIKYAEWEGDEADAFAESMEKFLLCTDKFAGSDEMRTLRRNITKRYFVLYEKVFLKAYEAGNMPVYVELFLDFGLADDRLITEEHMEEICSIQRDEGTFSSEVYTMREWLTLIYSGKKEPSKSEFDMDYAAMLRDRRKRGEITDEQAKELERNLKERLHYEITNMLMYNNRLLNGQMSTYVPVMYSEAMTQKLTPLYMGRKKVNAIINKFHDVDRTVFRRELMYEDKELGIEKEFVMKEFFPDIVLLPVYGTRGVMWQEIEGKRRDSHARFLMPAFYEGNPDNAMIGAFARFRWELCRTMQGSSWNNIQVKSLTSEYCDYLQFYNKNRDLSEEKREKVKLQMQKAKGSTREAFVMDYDLWIRHEVSGSIRLNKVAREILATYCPFNPSIRQKLQQQPIFEDAMARFTRERLKKNLELDNHYKALKKQLQQLPEALQNNLEYYKEL